MSKLQRTGIIILCACLLSGCQSVIPEMDDETQELVVEYAASMVRKYNEYQPSRLLELEEVVVEDEMQEVEPEADVNQEEIFTAAEEEQYNEEVSSASDSEAEVLNKEEEQPSPASLEDFYELEDMMISYEGYELKQSYPDEGDNLYFAMDATQGMQLLILKFNLQNHASADQVVDFLGKGIRYKIEVDGTRYNALTTMLLNDMSNYQGTIAAAGMEELVLVCEIPEESYEQFESLSIIVKNVDETATISLN